MLWSIEMLYFSVEARKNFWRNLNKKKYIFKQKSAETLLHVIIN